MGFLVSPGVHVREIDLTNIGIHDLPCEHVFVFKITGMNPHSTKD